MNGETPLEERVRLLEIQVGPNYVEWRDDMEKRLINAETKLKLWAASAALIGAFAGSILRVLFKL